MASFTKKVLSLAGVAVAFTSMAYAGAATCAAPVATTGIIRAEGTAEQLATLTFVCTVTAGGQGGALGINAQVFLSPALPVTSKVLLGAATEATVTITSSSVGAGPASVVQGTVSGSTINFSGTTPTGAQAAADTLTFVITNVRVNATSLSIGSGVPPSISETVFVSGASVVPAALASTTVGFAQNGLGASATFKTFTVGAAFPAGAATVAGVNNFVNCIAYSPKLNAFTGAAASVSGTSLAAVLQVNENFAQGFRSAASEVAQTVYAAGAIGAGSAANGVISTRVKVSFANVPTGVTILLPVGAIPSTVGAATITWVTSDTGGTAAATDSLDGANGVALRSVALTSGAGSVTFSVTADDLTNLDKFNLPVFVITTANTVPGGTTAFTASVSFAPVGSTSIPNFVVGASTATSNLSVFSQCTTSLLFPFVTNQLGFDTGLAISNTSTDPFGAKGATAQAGTCALNFYGAGAPSPANVVTPNVPTGTVYTQVLSGVAAGFQGYIIAQCNFQYAHGFAFITNGVGANGGLSQGYLAGVIPDVNQVNRAANPQAVAPAGTGETLAN